MSQGKGVAGGVPEAAEPSVPRSVEIASGGIDDTRALSRFGSALIGDIMTGAVSPKIANPVCRTGNLVLRAAEMEHKHNGGHPMPLS